jgi:hypothetical protein
MAAHPGVRLMPDHAHNGRRAYLSYVVLEADGTLHTRAWTVCPDHMEPQVAAWGAPHAEALHTRDAVAKSAAEMAGVVIDVEEQR